MTTIKLDNKVAIVTGAGRGLGRAHALELARRGATVIVNDVGENSQTEPHPAQTVVAEIEAAGGTAALELCDISTPEGATGIVERATEAYGSVDIVVNNAGILRDRTLAKMTQAEVDSVLAVHVGGTIWMTKAAWPGMSERGFGRIVNTSSAAGIFGNFGQTNYAAAKGAIWAITKTTALEGAKFGINVNGIEPGARTRMTENLLGELADRLDPSLVSPLVAWLVSDQCTTTGEVYNVAGGRFARVVIAQNDGLFDPEATAETIAASWDHINDVSELTPLETFADEMAILTRLMGLGG